MTSSPSRGFRVLLLSSALSACGPSAPDDGECAPYAFALAPVPASTRHLTCSSSACGDGQNPPTSGEHCSDTLGCRVHTAETNRCVWLHNLEHGHAVFLYNCPDGCPELVAGLEGLQHEARVGGNGVVRALVAPDSRLPTRVAALLWRRSWSGDTLDPTALRCLLRWQDADAPEPGLACSP
ncbi:DUF3105 domain-containing protein [Archangium primigenium]|uniref:DUF3105 domain-containing protein n=1 Tax=[Archangium] primigenium TaxID=2792470 RepID=UPI001957F344|nr:DUF3105 domain-containing protein [Archangium primigenium]